MRRARGVSRRARDDGDFSIVDEADSTRTSHRVVAPPDLLHSTAVELPGLDLAGLLA